MYAILFGKFKGLIIPVVIIGMVLMTLSAAFLAYVDEKEKRLLKENNLVAAQAYINEIEKSNSEYINSINRLVKSNENTLKIMEMSEKENKKLKSNMKDILVKVNKDYPKEENLTKEEVHKINIEAIHEAFKLVGGKI
jgi:type II secretory pathway pseudopilin PulG